MDRDGFVAAVDRVVGTVVVVLLHQPLADDVTPNTVVKAYGELESAGLIHKRRGAGTYVSDVSSPLADRERQRLIEQRIDALLAEAHQLNFSADEVVRVLRQRLAAMPRMAALGAVKDEE